MEEKMEVCSCNAEHKDSVLSAKKTMLSNDEIEDVSMFFKVLGDATRMKIMWALDRTELCVCDVAEVLDMSVSAISHQLNTLKQAKLVKMRKEGKNVFYSLDDEHITQIIEVALLHTKHK